MLKTGRGEASRRSQAQRLEGGSAPEQQGMELPSTGGKDGFVAATVSALPQGCITRAQPVSLGSRRLLPPHPNPGKAQCAHHTPEKLLPQ